MSYHIKDIPADVERIIEIVLIAQPNRYTEDLYYNRDDEIRPDMTEEEFLGLLPVIGRALLGHGEWPDLDARVYLAALDAFDRVPDVEEVRYIANATEHDDDDYLEAYNKALQAKLEPLRQRAGTDYKLIDGHREIPYNRRNE